jgi:Family of unknown function (DUF6599)
MRPLFGKFRLMKGKAIGMALLLVGVWAGPAAAQELLPSSFGSWTATGASTHARAAQIGRFAGDQAPILSEYGLTAAEQRDYTRGSQTAKVTLYGMTDPSAAYGAFTFLRGAPLTTLALGSAAPYAAGSPTRALLVVGNFFLNISSPQARPGNADLAQLASSVAPESDRRPFPTIGQFLPQSGLIHGSERYVLGPRALAHVFPMAPGSQTDWIGFANSAEAIVARYHLPGQPKDKEAVLLVALYPTQQIAAGAYAALSNRFAINANARAASGHPVVYGTRSSALVALLDGAASRQQAGTFLGQIRDVSLVTWDEPTQELTDPSISTIVVGAIVDTGVLMILVLAAGLGFGGLRLFIKFMLPGRVFDRNEQVEILQLGLASKPIDNKAFYALGSSRQN